MAGDDIEIRPEVAGGVAGAALQESQEGFLGDIEGQVGIAQHSEGQVVDPREIALIEERKGLRIAMPHLDDGRLFPKLGSRTHNPLHPLLEKKLYAAFPLLGVPSCRGGCEILVGAGRPLAEDLRRATSIGV